MVRVMCAEGNVHSCLPAACMPRLPRDMTYSSGDVASSLVGVETCSVLNAYDSRWLQLVEFTVGHDHSILGFVL